MPHIIRQTIPVDSIVTLSWFGDKLIDWASAGTVYAPDGTREQINKYHFAYKFDAALTSPDGQYAFIYKRLGTKGLLIHGGEIVREINRSYYHADDYEYPAAFFTGYNGRTYLAHCPQSYDRIDFEDAETGEIITNTTIRQPEDIFHSRLEVSSDNRYLLSKGWFWHPWDVAALFDIAACMEDPSLLDRGRKVPGCTAELFTAGFIDHHRVLVGASPEEPFGESADEPVPPGHIAIWNIADDSLSPAVKINGEFGNLIPIDNHYCWDVFRYPKLINIHTGDIEARFEDIDSGMQNSSILRGFRGDLPLIAFNRMNNMLAIVSGGQIECLRII